MMGQKKAIVNSTDQSTGATAMPANVDYKETEEEIQQSGKEDDTNALEQRKFELKKLISHITIRHGLRTEPTDLRIVQPKIYDSR